MPVETTGAQVIECPQCDHVMIMRDLTTGNMHCCPRARCVLQSEEILLAPTLPEMVMTTEQTTSFIDANPGSSTGSGASPLDYELADAQTAADLSSFLSRPVRIFTGGWGQSDPVGLLGSSLSPWLLFLNNASIKNKLTNYAFIRGNLKLKIVTNASPFLYGSLRATYRPLPGFKPNTATSSFPSRLVPISQMPGVWITPAHSEGAEFTCPFIWPRSFARVGLAADATNLGALDLVIYNTLASANGANSAVTVQIYAWMEDVTLAGPTLAAALQADEYGVGVVSAPASAVAAAASTLSTVPVIGKFAKATEIGASAVSNIAKLFGFTNVPVIEDTRPVRNSPFPQLASAEIGYPHEKLALDAKNELSIDPAIAGLGSEDELAISNFVQRESYLTGFSWSSASGTDTPLFTSVVRPQLTFTVGNTIDFPPAALAAAMFRNWRGDMIFRFRFIATPFHKGRVRISYDPYSSDVQTTGDTGPYVFNRVVDLGAETDVEFRVPYQQALPWCYTDSDSRNQLWSTSASPALVLADTFHNGMLSMKVLTSLTGPTSTASVGVQVFVRGAENLEFSNPSIGRYDLTPYAVQSEEYHESGSAMADVLGAKTDASSHRGLVNFGETISSLRALMRRHVLLDTVVIPTTSSSNGVYYISQTRFPAHYGYDPNGWNVAKGVAAPATNFACNFVNTIPWHLISNCFLAQRGSMNWIFSPSKGSLGIVSRISRYNLTFTGYTNGYNNGANTNANIQEWNYWLRATGSCAGSSLTHTNTTSGHAITAPSYTPFKFQTTSPSATTSPGAPSSAQYDGSVYDTLRIEYPYDSADAPISGVTVERYVGIGTDYTLHFFMNCPTLTYLNPTSMVPV
uniref:Structural polyprotein n=1 Tax=Robinvale bee virus 8 TaxID=2201319 RepID=A0A2U8JQA3_9VIRU|nr:structural polyprotein [Robinvale bee virus 8]